MQALFGGFVYFLHMSCNISRLCCVKGLDSCCTILRNCHPFVITFVKVENNFSNTYHSLAFLLSSLTLKIFRLKIIFIFGIVLIFKVMRIWFSVVKMFFFTFVSQILLKRVLARVIDFVLLYKSKK